MPAAWRTSHKGDYDRAADSVGRWGGWAGESFKASVDSMKLDSPQSMLLSTDQNIIMRMPNFSSFMEQQENLQALLVDIHEDPQGFMSFVEHRRESFAELGEATVAALSSGEENLSDYVNFRQVGKGRFSSVFYAEKKAGGLPRAIKRIQLASKQDDPLHQQQQRRQGQCDKGTRPDDGTGWADLPHGEVPAAGDGGDPIADYRRRGKGRRKKNEMTYEQCLKEVGLLKNLTSPNIVKLDTCFLDENVLWVVMEWVDGGDLKGVITRTRQAMEHLSELTVWSYFTQICDALLHMHSQRIMHRDLKPANILVCMNGTVKLGDLGLGRYLHTRSALAMSQVGTPLYMSPEALQGQGHELVSDIWSLGCVLYELAMLTSPFATRHLTIDKLFSKIVRADYFPVDRNLYSERLSNLVDHLLLPDPNIRPNIDMVQPASHLALQAQRKGVQGLDVENLAACARHLYPSCEGDTGHGNRGHAKSAKKASCAQGAVSGNAHRNYARLYPPSPTRDVEAFPPPPNTPTSDATYQNMKAVWGDRKDTGGGELPTDGNSPYAGKKCGLGDSALSKSDVGCCGTHWKSLLQENIAEVSRRHSFSGSNVAAP